MSKTLIRHRPGRGQGIASELSADNDNRDIGTGRKLQRDIKTLSYDNQTARIVDHPGEMADRRSRSDQDLLSVSKLHRRLFTEPFLQGGTFVHSQIDGAFPKRVLIVDHRAATGPDYFAFRFKLVKVPPDRHLGHAECFTQLADLDGAASVYNFFDLFEALFL